MTLGGPRHRGRPARRCRDHHGREHPASPGRRCDANGNAGRARRPRPSRSQAHRLRHAHRGCRVPPLFGMSGIEGRCISHWPQRSSPRWPPRYVLAVTLVPVAAGSALYGRPRSGDDDDVAIASRVIKRAYAPALDRCLRRPGLSRSSTCSWQDQLSGSAFRCRQRFHAAARTRARSCSRPCCPREPLLRKSTA